MRADPNTSGAPGWRGHAAESLLHLFPKQLLVSGSLLVESDKRENILLVRALCCFCHPCLPQQPLGPPRACTEGSSHPWRCPALCAEQRVAEPSAFRASRRPGRAVLG